MKLNNNIELLSNIFFTCLLKIRIFSKVTLADWLITNDKAHIAM